jgi:hypothetical protein
LKPENYVRITGRVTIKPIFSPGINKNGSIDFEIGNREGHHQVISEEKEIIQNMHHINLRDNVRVYGSLSSRTGDCFIVAKRIEFD